ncbi:hypothetical protein EHO60_16370 [Leptospira fletcheri]|uniref:Uncharacterized protein n=1 Tax=Leptospira fletcheri TaxID=2484981 RepID=A0A4R9G3V3_9LEPT|nr:hypothetical protein [Leptospira fletcheri]TGK06168.1 hypothetical protein EHO60_16370 [Leptospira fletcheri]
MSHALTRSAVFEPYGHSDVYALDNLYFSAFKHPEVWDFSRIRELSVLNLAFLAARGELAASLGKEIRVQGLTSGFKKGFCRIEGKEELSGIDFDIFLPTILGGTPSLVFSRIEGPADSVSIFPGMAGKGFQLIGNWKERNYRILFLTGEEMERDLPGLLEWVNEISSASDLRGSFYCRTEKQSYLQFLKGKEEVCAIFLQEKERSHFPFLFLAMEYIQETEKKTN